MSEVEKNVRIVVETFTPIFNKVFMEEFQEFQKFPMLYKFESRTQSNMLRDLFIIRFENEFRDNPRVRIRKVGQLFLIILDKIYFFRVKKLDSALRARNSFTKQSVKFSNQISLFSNETANITNLNLGYVRSRDGLSIRKTVIVCPDGNKVNWYIDMTPLMSNEIVIDNINESESSQKVANVRVKDAIRKNKSKTG